MRETHYQAARKHLEEHPWSLAAIAELARAVQCTPDRRGRYAGALLGSLLGRPGLRAVETLLA